MAAFDELPAPQPYGADVSRVMEDLYLGSAPPRIHVEPGATVCRYLLEQLNVGYVINVAAKHEPCILPRVTYYDQIKVEDRDTDITARNLLRHLPQCIELLETAKRARKSIYVHCQAGESRSPAIVWGILVMHYHMSLKEAFEHLRKRRPKIYPQPAYFRELQQIELRSNATLKTSSMSEAEYANFFAPR